MPVIGERPEISLDVILLATDFSSASKCATGYAIQIARRYGACLHMVSVVDLNGPVIVTDGSYGMSLEESNRRNRSLLAELVAANSELRCVTHVPESMCVSDAIQEIADNSGAGLIVMGTTSKSIVKKLVLGSTAEGVVRSSAVPVLTIGPRVIPLLDAAVPFQRIVFATDQGFASERTLPVALAFAEDSGALIYICRVVWQMPESEGVDARLRRDLAVEIPSAARDWCDPEVVVVEGEAPEAILELAKRVEADLIILAPRKSGSHISHFKQGVTPSVTAQATCPVLSYCG